MWFGVEVVVYDSGCGLNWDGVFYLGVWPKFGCGLRLDMMYENLLRVSLRWNGLKIGPWFVGQGQGATKRFSTDLARLAFRTQPQWDPYVIFVLQLDLSYEC